MIQDIFPYTFNNTYISRQPSKDSLILFYRDQSILLAKSDNMIRFPSYDEWVDDKTIFTYLFTIADISYFLASPDTNAFPTNFTLEHSRNLKPLCPKHFVLAGITGLQLFRWYTDNQYCGRCKNPLSHRNGERALICKSCTNIVYPKISPAIMVAIVHQDKILMVRQAHGPYKKLALIAGFSEIGETIEETASREVFEEVGLKIKNLTYYKSQPWPFTDTLLIGFYAELDGNDEITLDKEELSQAIWVRREDIDVSTDGFSLTNEMILNFKNL